MPYALNEPPQHYMDLLLDAVCVVDRDSRFLFVSAAAERIFGYRPEEMIGHPVLEFVHPDDRERTQQAIHEILDGEPKPHFENRYLRKDGTTVHIMWSARWSEADQVRIAVARDVTEHKWTEALQNAIYAISNAAHAHGDLLTLFHGIDATLHDLFPVEDLAIALTDPETGEMHFPWPTDADHRASDPEHEIMVRLGACAVETGNGILLTPDSADAAAMPSDIAAGARNHLAVPLQSDTGVIGSLVVRGNGDAALYSDADRDRLQLVSVQIAAAIERRMLHSRLEYMAQHDSLTGLPNRALFQDRLESALKGAARSQSHLAVLYLDLDEFKHVNDTLGHAAGDQLLREAAHRLNLCVRGADTVGRLGGDEFAVLLDGIESPTDGATVAKKIMAAFQEPFTLTDDMVQLSPSIGIAVYPENGRNADEIIGHADVAMYTAKRSGGGVESGQ